MNKNTSKKNTSKKNNHSKKNNYAAPVILALATLLSGLADGASAQVPAAAPAPTKATLQIDLARPGPAIPATFGGLMTEEINHSYDGGLFAELIQNRTFQDPALLRLQVTPQRLPVHWSLLGDGKASLDRSDPVNKALPVSLRLDLSGGTGSVANDGYWGVPIRPDTKYTASFYAKSGAGFAGPVTASLLTDEGVTVTRAVTQPLSGTWQKYTVTLTTGSAAPITAKAQFVLSATGTGSVMFSLVSLFPPTYQSTPDGLRPDLMKLMADLKPGFIRLPGGGYLEGSSLLTRFNWKQMIGPADQRPGHMGAWEYRSSDGFGLPEYLLWCRQLGAEPVLAVFAGLAGDKKYVEAGSPEMAQYTQEALEEIEYVSGPATSEWGKRRAADGFAAPFLLHYVEIGNEDCWDPSGSYEGRFTEMAKAIRAKYPHLKIIATAPVKGFTPDLFDDHYYHSARQMMALATQYNKQIGPPVLPTFGIGAWSGRQPAGLQTFVGEWATQEGGPTPDLNAALADAAFVMGLEQNADAVPLECYAPLMVNVNPADPEKGYPSASQWPTNLIGYDALGSFGSPSYYAQVLLAKNRGDVALPSTLAATIPLAVAQTPAHGTIGVGTYHTQVEYKDITVTAPDGRTLLTADLTKDTHAWQSNGGAWNLQDQAIRPSAEDAETWITTGDPNWTDYTIHVQARKLSGPEGFLVLFHTQDGSNYRWWNVGGWGNTLARCEAAEKEDRIAYGPAVPFTVETGRWYDLRLEVVGNHVRGFVDGKLVTDTSEQPARVPGRTVFASATYVESGRIVIVKVVNAGSDAVDMAIQLRGAKRVSANGTATVLTGNPTAQNTLDQPTLVAPKQEALTNASASFHRTFPPHSLTLLRIRAEKVKQ